MLEKTNKAIKYLGWIIPFVIGLAGAYAVSGVVAQRPAPDLKVEREVAAIRASSPAKAHKSLILEKNVLGLARTQPDEAPEEPKEPEPTGPETWPLIGVVVGESRSIAIVIIDGESRILFAGDTVHGWTLTEIQTDRIYWRKGGEELVSFLSTDQEKVQEQKRKQQAKRRAMVKKATSFSSKTKIDRQYAKSLIDNPAQLLEQALYKPFKKDGEIIGFSVRNIQDDSVLQKIGMQDEDVLMRLNGEDIKSPTSLLQAYAGLEGSNTISVDVLRDGQVKSILLELE
jgi:general secretion pathway protein C